MDLCRSAVGSSDFGRSCRDTDTQTPGKQIHLKGS